MTFNVDGISLLERGETPDAGLAKELGELPLLRLSFLAVYTVAADPVL